MMRLLVFAVLGAVLASCIPVTVAEWTRLPLDQKGLTQNSLVRLEVNDRVRVQTRRKKVHTFTVTRTEDDAFHGVARDGKIYRIPYSSLDYMEARRRDLEFVRFPIFRLY